MRFVNFRPLFEHTVHGEGESIKDNRTSETWKKKIWFRRNRHTPCCCISWFWTLVLEVGGSCSSLDAPETVKLFRLPLSSPWNLLE